MSASSAMQMTVVSLTRIHKDHMEAERKLMEEAGRCFQILSCSPY